MTRPYALHEFSEGGEREVTRGTDLDGLLKERDRLADQVPPGHRRGYRVVDLDDPERGDAEWGDCGLHGTFDASGECARCEVAG